MTFDMSCMHFYFGSCSLFFCFSIVLVSTCLAVLLVTCSLIKSICHPRSLFHVYELDEKRWTQYTNRTLCNMFTRDVGSFPRVRFLELQNPTVQSKHDDPCLVLVHGAMSCASATWAACLPHLSNLQRFRFIYAVDLPGFGLSGYPSASDIDTKTFCDFLYAFLERIDHGRPVVLVGHSLGAFFCLETAHSYPSIIHSLVLVCPIGLLPTSSCLGAWWAVLFRVGFPGRWLRLLSDDVRLGLASRMLHVFPSSIVCAHELAYLGIRPCVNDIASRYLHVDIFSAAWTAPNLDKLRTLTVPVSLIFGETDSISPAHMAKVVLPFLSSTYVLPDTWHRPMSEKPEHFCSLLSKAIDQASIPDFTQGLHTKQPICIEWQKYKSSFCPRLTQKKIESQVYASLYR